MRHTQAQRITALMNAKLPPMEQQANILINNRTARRALAKLDKRKAKRTKQGALMTIEQARAKRWTPEARAKQAAMIHNWQPWQQSTGAKTEQGKITSSMNACKGYKRAIYRNERRIMSHGLRALRALNNYPENQQPRHLVAAGWELKRYLDNH